MSNGHMNIKRIIHRSLEEIKATIKIAKYTSWIEAINTFIAKIDIQIMNRNGYRETAKIKNRLIRKHDTILKYLEKDYSNFIKNYDFENVKLENSDLYRDKVWVCWWQGIENAPIIVQRCINTIKVNAGKHEVIVITEENYKEFIELPDWIEDKKKNGIISRTHYSDLLRFAILAKYGGIWLDSTFFCTKPKIEEYFSYPIWSIKRPDYLHCSIACGYFANYSLGCKYDNRRSFAIIRDFILQYWKENDSIIDYLLTDYLIVLAQRHDKQLKIDFENIIPNNPNCDELFKVLGHAFNEEEWKNINKNTSLFKLSWKHSFPIEVDGVKTFYGKIIDNEL